MVIKHQFPADGEYVIKVKGIAGYFNNLLGQIKGEQLEITIDGERVKLFDWDKEIGTGGAGKSGRPRAAGESRSAHHWRRVPRHQRRARQRTEQAVRADVELAGPDPRVPLLSRRRPDGRRRTVRREGHRGLAEPAQDFRLPSDGPARRRSCARQIVSTLARRAFRRPAPRGSRHADGVLSDGPEQTAPSMPASKAALQRILADPEVHLPRRARAARLAAGRPTGSATSSWHRGCRFSCGAAFPTRNC